MQNNQWGARLLCYVVLGLLSIMMGTGCGGGGGSGGSTGGTGSPPPTPGTGSPPATPPPSAVLDGIPESATELTGANGIAAVRGLSHGRRIVATHVLDERWLGTIEPNRLPEPDPMYYGLRTVGYFLERAMQRDLDPLSCGSGTAEREGGFDGEDGTGTALFTFDQCRWGGSNDPFEVSGRLRLTITAREGVMLNAYRVSYEDVRFSDRFSGDRIAIDGTVDFETPAADASQARMTVAVEIRDFIKRYRFAFRDFVTVFEWNDQDAYWGIGESAGDMGISGHGWVQFRWAGRAVQARGHSSLLEVSSISSPDGAFVALLDLQGDGSFDMFARGNEALWREWPRSGNRPPTILATPAPGNTVQGARLTLDGSFDPDLDFVRWQFTTTAQPNGAVTDVTFDPIAQVLTVASDRSGDFGLSVRASDHRGATAEEQVTLRIRYVQPSVEILGDRTVRSGEVLDLPLVMPGPEAGPVSVHVLGSLPGIGITDQPSLRIDTGQFPLFGTDRLNIAIRVSNPDYVRTQAVTILVDDTHTRLPWAHTGLRAPAPSSELRALRRAAAHNAEAVLGSDQGLPQLLAWQGSGMAPVWTYPLRFSSGPAAVGGGDIDGSGTPRLVVSAPGAVRVVDIADLRTTPVANVGGSVPGPVRIGGVAPGVGARIAAASRDAGSNANVAVMRGAPLALLRTLELPPGSAHIDIARLTSDGPEYLIAAPGRLIDLETFLQHPTPPALPLPFVVGNVDADSQQEIVRITEGGIAVVDGASLTIQHTVDLGFQPDFVELLDTSASMSRRVVTGGPGSDLLVYDLGASPTNPVMQISLPITEPGVQKVAVGDFGAGTGEQLLWSFTHDNGQDHVYVLLDTATGESLWQSSPQAFLSGPFWGGALAAATASEHLFLARVDESGIHRWILLDGDSGDVRVLPAAGISEVGAVAQVDWDQDGLTETLVHVATGGSARLLVFGHDTGALDSFPLQTGAPGPIAVIRTAEGATSDVVAVVGDRVVRFDIASRSVRASVTPPASACGSGTLGAVAFHPTSRRLYVACDLSVLAYGTAGGGLNLLHQRTDTLPRRPSSIAFAEDPAGGGEAVVILIQGPSGSRGLDTLQMDLSNPIAFRSLPPPISPTDSGMVLALGGNGLLVAHGGGGAFGRVSRFLAVDAFDGSTVATWRSDLIPGWITPGSMHVVRKRDGTLRFAYATSVGAFVTR